MTTLRTEGIGSLLRPDWLAKARADREAGRLSAADFKRVEDRAVDEAVAVQEAAGLDTERRSEPTLGALREAVSTAYPGLGGILPRCAVLVGGSRVADDTPLGPDDLVDVLPPFAGG